MIIKVHSTYPECTILLGGRKLDRLLYLVDIEDMQKKSYELAVTRIIIAKKVVWSAYILDIVDIVSLTRDQ